VKGLPSRTFYPVEGLKRRQVGQVLLCVQLDRQGQVLKAQVARSSGFPVLDGSALWALGTYSADGAIPELPPELSPGEDKVWLGLPVDFNPPPQPGAGDDEHAQPGPCARHSWNQARARATAKSFTDEDRAFFDAMNAAIGRYVHYPRQALDLGNEGALWLCVSIDRDSHLLDASIIRSSGIPLLDGEALLGLARAQEHDQLPKLPPGHPWADGKKFFAFSLPVQFQR